MMIALLPTPHSRNVLPSEAYMSLQSNTCPSPFISFPALMAAAVAAAISSSVTRVVQFNTGVTP